MDGIEKVFLHSPHRDAVTWHRNAADAARGADARLLVRSSIIGVGGVTPAEFIRPMLPATTTCRTGGSGM